MLCSLCRQLLLLSDLFDPKYLHEHVYPLALLLSADKVAEVRTSASFLVCVCACVCVSVHVHAFVLQQGIEEQSAAEHFSSQFLFVQPILTIFVAMVFILEVPKLHKYFPLDLGLQNRPHPLPVRKATSTMTIFIFVQPIPHCYITQCSESGLGKGSPYSELQNDGWYLFPPRLARCSKKSPMAMWGSATPSCRSCDPPLWRIPAGYRD